MMHLMHKQNLQPTNITMSAPGSCIMLGEHAVLHGHPAIVAALEQRLQVSLQACRGEAEHKLGSVTIQSSLGNWHGNWQTLAKCNVTGHPLRFVLRAIQNVLALSEQAKWLDENLWQLTITIDSAIDPTLGLGSSAAVTVATVGALQQWWQGHYSQQDILSFSVAVIRDVQGSGSGADAAASCYGGWVLYHADTVTALPLKVPSYQSLPVFRLVSVGYKTPTPIVIALVQQWQQQDPKQYADIYAAMADCVKKATLAINHANWHELAQSMQAYQQHMVALGVCDEGTQCTIDAIAAHAPTQDKPWACKISGSGLGDCVLCLGVDSLPSWPHAQMALDIGQQGVVLIST